MSAERVSECASERGRESASILPACLLPCMPAACWASQSLLSRFCAAPCCCSCAELNTLPDCRGEFARPVFIANRTRARQGERVRERESSKQQRARERVKSALRTRTRRRMSVKRQTGKKSKQRDQLLLLLWRLGRGE